MPTKKKEKSKTKSSSSDWLQCSLCGCIISQSDADLHTSSCQSTQHGFIEGKTLNGKLIAAEKVQGEDGVSVIKSVKDSENTVWLSIPAMQMCGLSIGQPCVINRVMVRRAWPAKLSSLVAVALTASAIDLLKVQVGDMISVERLEPSGKTAASMQLVLKEQNKLFETDEFSRFAAALLDGKHITEGTPLWLNYFGQLCRCMVDTITFEPSDPEPFAQAQEALCSPRVVPSTPKRSLDASSTSVFDTSVYSTPSEGHNASADANNSRSVQDLSESMSSLDISNMSLTSVSSPEVGGHRRDKYPNLVTPTKGPSAERRHCLCFVKVTTQTRISLSRSDGVEDEALSENQSRHSLEDLGGLGSVIEKLTSRIKRALQPSSSSQCVLLYGPAGVGKTVLAKALADHLGMSTVYVAGTDVWSKLFGEAEANLKKLFKSAKERSPSILVIDDIDVLCPRNSQAGQQVQRIVGTLLSEVDNCSSDKKSPVVVLGISNNKDNMDPSLLRAGRFGCEVEVGVPTAQQRLQILKVLLKKVKHTLTQEELTTVSRNAHGYVGADLEALVNEACLHTDHRNHPTSPLTMEDFAYAGLQIKPSALREIQLDIPQVRWSDIGGMSEVKMRLREAVELPLNNPAIFRELGIDPPRGLLMYGPPGCSKTMVARALATECHLNFLAVKGPELFNQYVGESEKAIREVFRKARSAAPSVIFFDEIDAIASKRGGSSGGGVDDRVLTQLLTEMDGMETLKDVFVMAATNRPDKMDAALLRPGRFDSLVYVPLPDAQTRREILETKFTKMAVAEDVDVSELVTHTHNYSGAELIQVCQEAAMFALRENLANRDVRRCHFDLALTKVQPQTDPSLLQLYTQFAKAKS